jgi:hypothetical protein
VSFATGCQARALGEDTVQRSLTALGPDHPITVLVGQTLDTLTNSQPNQWPAGTSLEPMTSQPGHRSIHRIEHSVGHHVVTGGAVAESVTRERWIIDSLEAQWRRKGATLSDKTARTEFGLTQDEIIEAIRDGKLQYRQGSVHGNPWLRLLRTEVEALVKTTRGDDYLKERQTKTALAQIDRELNGLRTQVAALEARRAELLSRPTPWYGVAVVTAENRADMAG